MKNLFFTFLICTLFSTCPTNYSKVSSGKYSITDMYNLIETEKNYLYENRLDSIYFIDSFFVYLSNYRTKLIFILKEEEPPVIFDKGFLIEDFFVYKKGIRKSIVKDCPYDYRAVIYLEGILYKLFLNIDISKDCKKFDVDKIRINKHRDEPIQKWLSVKTEVRRQNLRNGFINEWEDQYDVISKLTENEKFCRVVVNYFWNGFYSIGEKPTGEDDKKAWLAMEEIGYLMYLTGHGYSF